MPQHLGPVLSGRSRTGVRPPRETLSLIPHILGRMPSRFRSPAYAEACVPQPTERRCERRPAAPASCHGAPASGAMHSFWDPSHARSEMPPPTTRRPTIPRAPPLLPPLLPPLPACSRDPATAAPHLSVVAIATATRRIHAERKCNVSTECNVSSSWSIYVMLRCIRRFSNGRSQEPPCTGAKISSVCAASCALPGR